MLKHHTAAVGPRGVTDSEEKVDFSRSELITVLLPKRLWHGSVLILLGNLNQGNELGGVQNAGIGGKVAWVK